MIWDFIRALTALQCGLVSRSQILNAGATQSWIRWAVAAGYLKRVRRGVYAISGFDSERQALMAACLAGGPGVAASHLADAGLWGAEQVMGGRVEVTAFGNGHHLLPDVITHRSRLDPATATTTFRNIPIVVPPLAVVQVAE